MQAYDYTELIRVVKNVNIREAQEKDRKLQEELDYYEDECQRLTEYLIDNGLLDDWNQLKQLCKETNTRLCVACIGKDSLGIRLGLNNYGYASGYCDDGSYSELMNSGSCGSSYYGFTYEQGMMIWQIRHTTSLHYFETFDSDLHKYRTRVKILQNFIDTYPNYRKYLLDDIRAKYENRILTDDVIEK